ncbi:CpaF family protein [Devriesea agamarum]|uniref:CpaF family protein n=1 Tax=Devriesea agamarum TaxID=472569 RepID=UPI00071DB3A3|nr:ATPase, T2SS/T4P/T4SS family [Devriesea agamarum]
MTQPQHLPLFSDLPLSEACANQLSRTAEPHNHHAWLPHRPDRDGPDQPNTDNKRSCSTHLGRPRSADAGQASSSTMLDRDTWAAVTDLRSKVAQALALNVDDGLDPDSHRARAMHLTTGYISDHDQDRIDRGLPSWTNAQRRDICRAVMESLFGFGRLQPLLDDPTIENIEIYGSDDVLIQRVGNVFGQSEPIADSNDELLSTLAFFATQQGKSFDPAHPRLHMSLGPRARLQATGWIVDPPCATIRVHRLIDVDLNSLVELDVMPADLADFLRAAVKARKSIIVGGAQGAGKTTLLRALINEIDPWEKIATLESTFELHLDLLGHDRHRRLIALEAVPGSDEKDAQGRPIGEITMDDLARDTFRMNLDRLIVGEILGPEVISMFEAMQTGSGSLSTIHAKSPCAIPGRIVTLARKDGRVTEDFARRQVAENIDLAVFVDVVRVVGPDGLASPQRRVTAVNSYEPGENGAVATTGLWTYSPHGAVNVAKPVWYRDLEPYLTAGGSR